MAFAEGYVFGLAMILLLGPVFFTLLRSTLQYGTKAGIAVAFGVLASDIAILALCSIGTIGFFESSERQNWLALAGSLVLFFIGLKYLFNPQLNANVAFNSVSTFGFSSFFLKGFVVNFINPFVFAVWIATLSYSNKKFGDESIIFLIAMLLGIFTTDGLKVFLSSKIQKLLSVKILKKIYFVSGLVLICFGMRLLYYFFYY
jgi:threonine/homoserine/homoserine lactone efflux protein